MSTTHAQPDVRAKTNATTRVLYSLLAILALALVLPRCAAAEAVPGQAPTPGPSGLPDGRVYEQASPFNKPGSEAGAPIGEVAPYIAAGVNGDEVAFSNSGPLGDTQTGFDFFSIARRSPTGWVSHGAVSRGQGIQRAFFTNPQEGLGFSADMTATVFGAEDTFVPEQELGSPTPHLYRFDEDGLVQWIGKPTIARPVPYTGAFDPGNGDLAGSSPDMDTIYYAFEGTLVPADEERNPSLGDVSRVEAIEALEKLPLPKPSSDDELYRWHDGTLEAADVLPDGRLDPYGAVPAGSLKYGAVYDEETLRHQVSENGEAFFFLSPDPGAGSERPPELYVRKVSPDGTNATTSLVSRDLLLPESGGFPAGASSGVRGREHFYASPDGSRAFFDSTDQLTSDAPSGSDNEYEFNTVTDTLKYLPGVAGPSTESRTRILASSRDGSNFLYWHNSELESWSEGKATPVASGQFAEEFEFGPRTTITHATPTGSVYVFQIKRAFPGMGFNNGGGAYHEVYSYTPAANTLTCVSCPPAGVSPTGDGELSHDFGTGEIGNTLGGISPGGRGISEDGSRIFFDSPDALVPRDTNGVRDVYEWENGVMNLISTGVSQEPSYFGDNTASGNDVFFSTSEGLNPGDVDEGYDVYDARVPRPGDQLLPSAVPCEGSVCQGPPSVPQLFSVPASETFNGAGDVSPPPQTAAVKPKASTGEPKHKRSLQACRRQKKRAARKRCERQARGSAVGRARQSRGNRRHGRGN